MSINHGERDWQYDICKNKTDTTTNKCDDPLWTDSESSTCGSLVGGVGSSGGFSSPGLPSFHISWRQSFALSPLASTMWFWLCLVSFMLCTIHLFLVITHVWSPLLCPALSRVVTQKKHRLNNVPPHTSNYERWINSQSTNYTCDWRPPPTAVLKAKRKHLKTSKTSKSNK